MLSFSDPISTKLTVKGSKFIAFGQQTENLQATDEFLESIKKEHHKATHHCTAYRLCEAKLNRSREDTQVDVEVSEYSNDDGEPSGTAGIPILNALKSSELVQSMIIIVRYYGGTKLGTSGLIDAYGSTAAQLIDKSELLPVKVLQKVRITYSYAQQSEIDKLKHLFNVTELNAEYLSSVTITLGVALDQRDNLITYLDQKEHLGVQYILLNPILSHLL